MAKIKHEFPTEGVHGQIVSWSCSNVAITYRQLIGHLTACDLDATVVHEMAPRTALMRALRTLEEDRVIDILHENPEEMVFQFTKKERSADFIKHSLETKLTFDKRSFDLTCENKELIAEVTRLFMSLREMRTTADVTRIIQKLFDKKCGHDALLPVREQGGCYFVPAKYIEFVDKVGKLVTHVGGRIRRFTVAAGDAATDDSVKQCYVDGIEAMVRDHAARIDAMTEVTRESTMTSCLDRIKETEMMADCYSEYLGESKRKLDEKLKELREQVNRKLSEGLETPAGAAF